MRDRENSSRSSIESEYHPNAIVQCGGIALHSLHSCWIPTIRRPLDLGSSGCVVAVGFYIKDFVLVSFNVWTGDRQTWSRPPGGYYCHCRGWFVASSQVPLQVEGVKIRSSLFYNPQYRGIRVRLVLDSVRYLRETRPGEDGKKKRKWQIEMYR